MAWLAAQFRADAVARLKALNTLAGISVEPGRASAVPDELLPFVGVYTDLQDNALLSPGGSEPQYTASTHLLVEPKIQATPLAAAESQIDTLVGQILDGLLCDPDWYGQFQRVPQITVNTEIQNKGGLYTGLGRITLVLEYVERYTPRLGGPITEVALTEQIGTQTIGATIIVPTP